MSRKGYIYTVLQDDYVYMAKDILFSILTPTRQNCVSTTVYKCIHNVYRNICRFYKKTVVILDEKLKHVYLHAL